ncbi:MAG: cyclic nucleotide-binding domain-containing protein [Gammaproteobacteria bacterium]|jgi:CRP-like cAMP-binding protein/rhodanese-related sulfurtransferase|nr:cyclic nucleotide-binding domain-containing protein [Gammaproteobacteria bacterium]
MSEHIDVTLLSRYQPLNALNPDNLQEVLKHAKVEEIAAGKILFKKGDTNNAQIYLLKGDIELLGDSGVLKTIKAGSTDGLNPIAHILPRTITAKSRTDITVFKVDGDLVDVMLTWDQTGNYQVKEFGVGSGSGEDDWMNRILQTEAFHRIPPANIQAIFMRMQSVPVKAGEPIIKQGEEGDYFYIVKKGRCLVTRSMPDQPRGIKLAELKDGDTFGEEALISSSKRNATVTMLTDGVLNRLSKKDFLELLNEPLLSWVDFEHGQNLVTTGQAVWLDVRLPAEHASDAIRRGEHIPLIFLRMKLNSLDTSKSYIVYCDTGRRSSAASYLLNERGITSYVLKDGLGSVPADFRTAKS